MVFERKNHSLMDLARPMLQVLVGLAHQFWEEALGHCLLCSKSIVYTLKKETTYSKWFGHPPNLAHLKVFGSPTYIVIPPKKRRNKVDSRDTRVVFVVDMETDLISKPRGFMIPTNTPSFLVEMLFFMS